MRGLPIITAQAGAMPSLTGGGRRACRPVGPASLPDRLACNAAPVRSVTKVPPQVILFRDQIRSIEIAQLTYNNV
jgi:hypothetical protein